ncbi:ribonuclease H, partial [Trifolium pratense]
MNELRGNQGEDVGMQYQELSARHATLLIQEEGYWKQRAKMHWLREGDLNTRFFHMSATARSKKKRVTRLTTDTGTEALSQEDLCEVAKNYFGTLFRPRNGDYDPALNLIQTKVTEDDNFLLTAPITKVEIQQALFQMHPDKSPGPDGFNPAFYQRFWEKCSDDIFLAATTWLERGLKCCLDKCVSQEQSAFVEGRSILDNALISIEVIHALKRKTQGRRGELALKIDISKAYDKRKTQGRRGELALKIDISKAYDKVDWGFLRGVLTKMGFSEVWIR